MCKRALVLLSVMCLLVVVRVGNGVGNPAAGDAKQLGRPDERDLGGIIGDDIELRLSTYRLWSDRLLKQRIAAERVAERKLVKYERFYDPRQLAVEMLGDMRSFESIQVLIDNIEWHYHASLAGMGLFNEYPCAHALVKMGLEVVPRVLNSISRNPEPSDKRIRLVAAVIFEVYGGKSSIHGGSDEAIAVVERFAKRTPAERQAALNRILAIMRQGSARNLGELLRN